MIGERIVDSRSSAEMARRLIGLQRQRIAENQVIDRQARRALHDEVLPRLHAAMLALTSKQQDSDQNTESVTNQLGDIHRLIADLLREMPAGTTPAVARLGLIGALRQVVNEEYARIFDQINWSTTPEAEQKASEIPPLIGGVIYYAACEIIRNAARHGQSIGVETPLNLDIEISVCETFQIMIQDNGSGFDTLTPPASLPNNGAGQGLALHSTLMAVVGGSLSIESVPGKTRVLLNLPIQISPCPPWLFSCFFTYLQMLAI